MIPARARRKPYTARGISRTTCSVRLCRREGFTTWQVCADARAFRVLCALHDIALNRLVLEWAGDPLVERKMTAYVAGFRQ